MAKVFKKTLSVLAAVFFLGFFALKLADAEVFYAVSDCLKIILPEAQNIKEETKVLTAEQKNSIAKAAAIEFDPDLDKEYKFYIGDKDGKVIGYAVEDRVKGKWGAIDYMLGFDPDGKIKDVIVMELKERRGRPVKERRFLDQFKGKSIQEPIKLNKDIKGVAGATISSRGMSNGIRKLVYIFNELYKK